MQTSLTAAWLRRHSFLIGILLVPACRRDSRAAPVQDSPQRRQPVVAASRAVDTVVPDTGVRTDAQGRLVFPIVFASACEGEDCETSFPALACDNAVLHGAPNGNAAIVARVTRGDSLVVKRTDVHVLHPGIVVLKQAYVLDADRAEDGEAPHPRADTLRFAAGDTLYLLRYLALGEWVWWRGRVSAGSEFWAGPVNGRLGGAMDSADSSRAVARSQPAIQDWWLIQRPGGAVGWWLRDSLPSIRSIPQMRHWEEHC
jgi:hypothetical protein